MLTYIYAAALSRITALPVMLTPFNGNLLTEDQIGQRLLGGSIERLFFLRGIYAGKADLVLSVCVIQNSNGVSISHSDYPTSDQVCLSYGWENPKSPAIKILYMGLIGSGMLLAIMNQRQSYV